jgi:hypothetical protein
LTPCIIKLHLLWLVSHVRRFGKLQFFMQVSENCIYFDPFIIKLQLLWLVQGVKIVVKVVVF